MSADERLELRRAYNLLQTELYNQSTDIKAIRKDLDGIMLLVNGDTNRDILGLRARMRDAEKTVDEWRKYKLLLQGMAIGMALTMVTSVANLVTLLSQAAK